MSDMGRGAKMAFGGCFGCGFALIAAFVTLIVVIGMIAGAAGTYSEIHEPPPAEAQTY